MFKSSSVMVALAVVVVAISFYNCASPAGGEAVSPERVAALEEEIASLKVQLAAVQSNKALLLGPYVTVDPNSENGLIGPNIVFTGANVHIVDGSGATDDNGGKPIGLGNLVIGYDENFPLDFSRTGSHNLVVGIDNGFSSVGGLVAGTGNQISRPLASVSGGFYNTASGFGASVSGGADNTASGFISSVSGGNLNVASGDFASILGGNGITVSTTDGTSPLTP